MKPFPPQDSALHSNATSRKQLLVCKRLNPNSILEISEQRGRRIDPDQKYWMRQHSHNHVQKQWTASQEITSSSTPDNFRTLDNTFHPSELLHLPRDVLRSVTLRGPSEQVSVCKLSSSKRDKVMLVSSEIL